MRLRVLRDAAALATAGVLVVGAVACSPASDAADVSASAVTSSSVAANGSSSTAADASGSLWDSSMVHDISLDVDQAELTTLLETYASTGDKDWISANVTIDGKTFENVGIKLKGNSTLRGTNADSDPATLPWLIRLDKFVDDQSYDGQTELVVRGNSSETSLNEAVALELLGQAGLATQEAVSSRFSVNGGTQQLRLVIQNPDQEWTVANFADDGLLYKADSEGDYSYRGDDPDSYADVFEQEAGDDDLTPLTDFLKFINESDDATFASDLPDRLDVNAFATYLAFQDLVDNFDDIDGPGNNSYLYYDPTTKKMTVVNWDLNLAFGSRPGGMGGGGQRPGGDGQGFGGGSMGGKSNVLADRFLANADFKALYDQAKTDLQASLYTNGAAQEILDRWVELLKSQATDLVSEDQITSDAATVSKYFTT